MSYTEKLDGVAASSAHRWAPPETGHSDDTDDDDGDALSHFSGEQAGRATRLTIYTLQWRCGGLLLGASRDQPG